MRRLGQLAISETSLSGYVFIFDTLKKFVDVINKKNAKDFLKLMRKLSTKGATVCLLGHTNKYTDAILAVEFALLAQGLCSGEDIGGDDLVAKAGEFGVCEVDAV